MSDKKNSEIPLRHFSIYLIKEDRKNITDIVKIDNISYRTKLVLNDIEIGELFVKPTKSKLPRWYRIFDGYIDKSKIGEVANSSALLLINVKKRFFAVTFGQGRYLLQSNCWVERFGLRVVLNSIGEYKIKSIDKKTFDAISKQSREQASREVGATDFGLDIEQDLLRAVTGTPTDTNLGRKLSGMDVLTTVVRVNLENIPFLVEKYYEKFLDNSYKDNFPWVDHLSEVKDQELLDRLDILLTETIFNRHFKRCWLATPDLVDWDRTIGFSYSKSPKSGIYHDIHFQNFLDTLPLNEVITKHILTHKFVYCHGDEDILLDKWSVYKCINCEIDHENSSFLLSSGKWYLVSQDFVTEVNTAYERIPRYEDELPEYNHDSEPEYNEYVTSESNGIYTLMDRRNIQYGGSYSKVEFCDLYKKSKDIIHVKRYGGSSVLSHLFAQGIISGELFQTDERFRAEVNKLLPDTHKISDVSQPPVLGQYRVVYAIISDSDGDQLELPFFSRLNLKHAVRRLEGYGYKVSIAKISVNEMKKKTIQLN